jgi:sigma-B regulation protein RsbU (phosphoserine phosphatase)
MDTPSHDSERGFRSLTARLIVWTLLAVGAVYGVTVFVSNSLARRMALAAAEREAVNETDGAAGQVQDVLHVVEDRVRVLADVVQTLDPAEEDLERILASFVLGHREVFGAAIAFEPGERRPGEGRLVLYQHRVPDRAERPQILAPSQRLEGAELDATWGPYRQEEWYAEPLRTGEPRWTEPYFDDGGGGVNMVTWSVPLERADGTVRGFVTADLRLRWLDALVRSIELGRSGFGVILSRQGHIIAHSHRPEDTIVASERVLDAATPEERARLGPIVERMVAGKPGFEPIEIDGRRYRLTFRPLGHAGWSMAVAYPEDELLEGVGRLRAVQSALALGGLAVLALVVVLLSRRLTRPLGALAASADEMSTGDLDAGLPTVESRDEIGRLTAAFHHMRDSLKTYIRDLEETTAAKERLESELKVARRIQADMLPKGTAGGPDEGYELAATLVPARAVGGDLFNYFRDGSRLFFLVGDVSGKGVPAALFMARTKTLFEAVASRDADPGAVLAAANHNLRADNDAGMFVTAVCGVLDVGTGELTFALAGHDPPVFVPAEGDPEPLQVEGGRVLGLIEGSDYPVNRLRLGHRDALVMFTDGVSEAQDVDGGFFEIERIVDTLQRHRHEDAVAMTRGLLEAVRGFAGEAPQSDDITLMTLRYLSSPS